MASDTGGVKPMALGGRMVNERERLIGMTQEERAWRKQYLRDLELPHGPKIVPQLDAEFTNPIRRFYKFPLDKLCDALTPTLGHHRAFATRYWIGKFFLFGSVFYAGAYYLKYNQNDWTRKGGWRVLSSRKACNPGDPGYPQVSDRKTGADYAARGFKEAPI